MLHERENTTSQGLRATIFDLDGVLVDSYRAHLRCWQQLGKESDVTITEREFAPYFGRTGRDVIWHFWRSTELSEQRVEELHRCKRELYRANTDDCLGVMDGAVDLIDALDGAGFRLAVASSGPRDEISRALAQLERSALFPVQISGQDVNVGKPDPEMFLLAASRLGLDPARCIVVEDAPAGIAASRAAGMTTIGLAGGPWRAHDLRDADRVVHSLRELSSARILGIKQTPDRKS